MRLGFQGCRAWIGGVLLWAGSCLLLAAAFSQQASLPQQANSLPTLQANARAVLIDVVVTDAHGHAIHGLTRQDFHVAEDDAPQTIASFEEIEPPPPGTVASKAASPLPVNTFTNARKPLPTGASTVILLDALDTPLSAQSYSRDQLLKFVQTMQPSGPVAIFELDTQLHLIQGFTSDPDELRQAVKARAKVMETVIPRTGGYVATQFRYDDLTHAFASLGVYLAKFPGRKNLIWFTGSVPVYAYDDGSGLRGALRDPESFSFDYTGTTALLTLGRVSIYPIDAEGLRSDPAFSAERGTPPGIGEISHFSLHEALKHEDLMDVAAATGGRAFVNTNGIRQAIGEVIETGANYYTLSYTPTNAAWNGEYRRLKVTLDRPDARLEYRRGYYARRDTGLSPASPGRRQITNHASVQRVPRTTFPQAMQLGALDPGGVVFQARVTAPEATVQGSALPGQHEDLDPKFRNKPVREFTVSYTLDGKQLQLNPAANGLHTGGVQFAVVVLDDQGRMVNSAMTTVDMHVTPETYQRILETGVAMPVEVAVPVKGDYFLRVGVNDLTSGHSGVVEVPVGEVKLGAQP